MAFYCDRADVLRALGGTNAQLRDAFGKTLWESTPSTAVEVDGVELEVPDALLDRIDREIESADSRADSSVLHAYKARPTSVPKWLRDSVAKIAAFGSLKTDGARPDWLREANKSALEQLDKIAAGKLDIGVATPRPNMRKPAARFFTRGGG
jgi:phage gp36-like protein